MIFPTLGAASQRRVRRGAPEQSWGAFTILAKQMC